MVAKKMGKFVSGGWFDFSKIAVQPTANGDVILSV
jgi:hypothetical protein